MKLLVLICVCFMQLAVICGRQLVITHKPIPRNNPEKEAMANITLEESQTWFLDFKFTNCSYNETMDRNLQLTMTEGSDRILHIQSFIEDVPCVDNATEETGVNTPITGKFLGYVKFNITDAQTEEEYLEYSVGVIRPPAQTKDQVYINGMILFTALATFTFGLSLEMGKVKAYLKKPIAPSIGVACQFLLMPLTGFVITLAMTDAYAALKLGIFASATAPGGGLSNIFIYVLDGDLDLSITMTFISTCAALGFLPFWMYTLGQYILKDSEIFLPFPDILKALAILVIPLAIGILLNRFLPKVTKILLYSQKPLVGLTMLFIVVYGSWVNAYAFRMVFTDVRLCLACFFLPYVGGLLGFCIALACKQGRKLAITISIETAVQNLNIAVVLLKESLEHPWADISSAIPIVIIICTFIPFPFMAIARVAYDRLKKKKKETEVEVESVGDIQKVPKEKEGIDNPAQVKDEKF